ncbi:MAG: hypothetical protein WAN76_27445 [Candidatus Sulfotelmatobacter sp.]
MLHARGDEVGGEGGDVVGDALGEAGGQRAGSRIERTSYERIGIAGEDLVVVVVRVVEEDAGVGDAVIGLDDRVVNLRNADEEDAVSGADDEWTLVAEGVSQSGARGEVIRLERNFAGWREQRVGDESCSSKGLQVPTDAEIERQVVGDADGVLCEGGVFVGVGI